MATLSDLTDAIDALLSNPLGTAQYQLTQQVEAKAYEAYIFGLCIRAIEELGVTPTLNGISGRTIPLIFRGAPRAIYSSFRNYIYATFTLNNEDFEVHSGVEFCGTSGMIHEVDVCIVRATDANRCRLERADPPASSLIAGWECKFYAGNLNKGLGRAFVGLMDDMGTNYRIGGMCSNAVHLQLRDYFKPQRRPYPHFRLTPLEPSNQDIFVNMIKGELKKMTGY